MSVLISYLITSSMLPVEKSWIFALDSLEGHICIYMNAYINVNISINININIYIHIYIYIFSVIYFLFFFSFSPQKLQSPPN